MPDRARGNMALGVEIMTMTAEGKEVGCIVAPALHNPLNVVKLERQNISADRVAAFVAGLPQHLIPDRDADPLARRLGAS